MELKHFSGISVHLQLPYRQNYYFQVDKNGEITERNPQANDILITALSEQRQLSKTIELDYCYASYPYSENEKLAEIANNISPDDIFPIAFDVINRHNGGYAVEKINDLVDNALFLDKINMIESAEQAFEMAGVKDIQQNNPNHFGSVVEHTEAVMKSIDRVAKYFPQIDVNRLKIAAAFHDIGKPEVKVIGKKGYDQFLDHNTKSRDIFNKVDLNLSKEDKDHISELIYYHEIDVNTKKQGELLTVINGTDEMPHRNGFVRDLIALKTADILGQSEYNRAEKLKGVLNFAGKLEKLANKEQLQGLDDVKSVLQSEITQSQEKEPEFLARTKNGADIYMDDEFKEHLEAHPVPIEQIREAIGKLEFEDITYSDGKPVHSQAKDIDMGRTVGKTNLITVTNEKELIMKLRQWQKEAISVLQGNGALTSPNELDEVSANGILSAPTGAGKTAVALNWADITNPDQRIILTAPIKAISNERFRDLYELYGDDVGINTGDLKINTNARVLCCTQEIYTQKYANIPNQKVIMDEFHYCFRNTDRIPAYVDGITSTNKDSDILVISATFGNENELISQLEEMKGQKFNLYHTDERATELTYHFDDDIYLEDMKNCLVFAFSVRDVMNEAYDIAEERYNAPIKQPEYKYELIKEVANELNVYPDYYETLLKQGVGVYYGKLDPKEKLFMETIYKAGLIDVMVGTDALAMGVNLPCETVYITSLEKGYDEITPSEFQQMAGRAGRFGYFNEGHCYSYVNLDEEDAKYLTEGKDEIPNLIELRKDMEVEYPEIITPDISIPDSCRTEEEKIDFINSYISKRIEDIQQTEEFKNTGYEPQGFISLKLEEEGIDDASLCIKDGKVILDDIDNYAAKHLLVKLDYPEEYKELSGSFSGGVLYDMLEEDNYEFDEWRSYEYGDYSYYELTQEKEFNNKVISIIKDISPASAKVFQNQNRDLDEHIKVANPVQDKTSFLQINKRLNEITDKDHIKEVGIKAFEEQIDYLKKYPPYEAGARLLDSMLSYSREDISDEISDRLKEVTKTKDFNLTQEMVDIVARSNCSDIEKNEELRNYVDKAEKDRIKSKIEETKQIKEDFDEFLDDIPEPTDDEPDIPSDTPIEEIKR